MDIKKSKYGVYAEYVSQKGQLIGFNAIFTPSTKFNKEGVYNASILISKKEGEELLKQIKEIRLEEFKNFKKGKNDKVAEITALKPYTTVDEETGQEIEDEEGRYILKASAKAKIVEGKPTNKIAVFDSKGHPIKSCKLGEGSIVRLKLQLVGYNAAGKIGVSIKISAVQIIKLIEYQTNNSGSFEGFEVEDAYEYNEDTESENKEDKEELTTIVAEEDNWEEDIGF